MTSATDTDIQQIKDLIAAGNTVTQKQIADLDKKMEVGFARIDGELKEVSNRLIAVETSTKGLDARLWGFGASLFGLVATALLGILVRYLFTHDSII
jgi:hypothetical protein